MAKQTKATKCIKGWSSWVLEQHPEVCGDCSYYSCPCNQNPELKKEIARAKKDRLKKAAPKKAKKKVATKKPAKKAKKAPAKNPKDSGLATGTVT